ncbi:unnamed protein product, partial [Polarella glacialis]
PGKQVKEEPDSLSMMVNLYNPSRGVRARPAPTSGCASEPLESSATDDGDVFMDEQASRAATSDTARERPCISSLFAEEVPPGSLPQVPLKSRARGAGKDDDATDSDHTVAKVYGNVEGDSRAPRPADWVSFCQRHGVGLIVRANFGDEKGISEHGGSYDPALLQPFGLKHLDVPIDDRHGAVPDARKMHDLLECCSAHSSRGGVGEHDDEAILLHCKGGFGRSVLLASCLIVAKYDLPGRSILGWVRIARPGAIITYQQERFLCSFGGRADWERCCIGTIGGSYLGWSRECIANFLCVKLQMNRIEVSNEFHVRELVAVIALEVAENVQSSVAPQSVTFLRRTDTWIQDLRLIAEDVESCTAVFKFERKAPRVAFVTLATGAYGEGALVLSAGLRRRLPAEVDVLVFSSFEADNDGPEAPDVPPLRLAPGVQLRALAQLPVVPEPPSCIGPPLMPQFRFCWAKLGLWALDDEYDVIVYMDADMLIVGDISRLLSQIPAPGILRAVPACECWCSEECCYTSAASSNESDFPKTPSTFYFNAGLLMFRPSREEFNAMKSSMLALSTSNLEGSADSASIEMPFAEQDFLNRHFRGRVLPLPPAFNALKHALKNPKHESALPISSCIAIHFVMGKPWAPPSKLEEDFEHLHAQWRAERQALSPVAFRRLDWAQRKLHPALDLWLLPDFVTPECE